MNVNLSLNIAVNKSFNLSYKQHAIKLMLYTKPQL